MLRATRHYKVWSHSTSREEFSVQSLAADRDNVTVTHVQKEGGVENNHV